jgi:hypothetical protein
MAGRLSVILPPFCPACTIKSRFTDYEDVQRQK